MSCMFVYYKAGLAGQWPFLRVLSAIFAEGWPAQEQRWPVAEDPRRLHCSITRASRYEGSSRVLRLEKYTRNA